jgi:hypothetical protein
MSNITDHSYLQYPQSDPLEASFNPQLNVQCFVTQKSFVHHNCSALPQHIASHPVFHNRRCEIHKGTKEACFAHEVKHESEAMMAAASVAYGGGLCGRCEEGKRFEEVKVEVDDSAKMDETMDEKKEIGEDKKLGLRKGTIARGRRRGGTGCVGM